MTGNPACTFILDFAGGAPLRLDCALPETARSPLDILPTIFRVADAIHEVSAAELAAMGKSVTCGPGCGICCHQLVPVSHWEVLHLAAVVRAMEPVRRRRVARRFARALQRLDDVGLLTRLQAGFENHTLNPRAMDALKRAYWTLRIPCPFLEEGSCSIHPHRPLACRQYLVTSAPDRCAALYQADQNHEVVVHAADTASALAAFSGTGIDRTRVLPHILSLKAAPSLHPEPTPLPADRMLGRFLYLLADHFAGR